jgi:hypothetical protein
MKKELPIPAACVEAKSAIELVRVWAADGAQHVSLATGLWPDPAAWGILLVDLARHVARAYEATSGAPSAASLARIREAFDVEWRSSTDTPTGSLID